MSEPDQAKNKAENQQPTITIDGKEWTVSYNWQDLTNLTKILASADYGSAIPSLVSSGKFDILAEVLSTGIKPDGAQDGGRAAPTPEEIMTSALPIQQAVRPILEAISVAFFGTARPPIDSLESLPTLDIGEEIGAGE